MRPTSSRTVSAVVAVAALAIGAGGGAWGYASSQSPLLHGCQQKNSGNLRLVEDPNECRSSELPVSWNQQGAQGEPGPPGPKGDDGTPGTSGTNLWAAVERDGTLLRHAGALGSATVPGSSDGGVFNVTFNRDVTGCAYLATIEPPAHQNPLNPQIGQVAARQLPGTSNGVQVTTGNALGVPLAERFYLAVLC